MKYNGCPFLFLRHGQSVANAEGVLAGQTDVPLTSKGRAQAIKAAGQLESWDLHGVYTSPLMRAHQTAEIIAEQLDLSVGVLEELAERNWGEREGQTISTDLIEGCPLGGEQTDEFHSRVLLGLERYNSFANGKRGLIISHGGVLNAFDQLLELGLAKRDYVCCRPIQVGLD